MPAARRTGSTTSRVTSTPMPTTNSVSATPLMITVLRMQREALLLLVQREGVVELDLLAAGGVAGHRAPISSVGCGTCLAVGHQGVPPGLAAVVDGGAQVGRQGAA